MKQKKEKKMKNEIEVRCPGKVNMILKKNYIHK
jgi:hypothetical protein